MNDQPLIDMARASLRIRDRILLPNSSWKLYPKQHWAILGPNGVGKSTFAKALFGRTAVVGGRITCRFSKEVEPYPSANAKFIGYVSPEVLREILKQEAAVDESRHFSGNIYNVTTAADIIAGGAACDEIDREAQNKRLQVVAGHLDVKQLIDRDFRSLSTGELRRVLIARALMKKPRLLILDEPFDGLAGHSLEHMRGMIDGLIQKVAQVVLITQRETEILPGITHVMYLKENRIHAACRKELALKPELINQVFGIEASSEGALGKTKAFWRPPLHKQSKNMHATAAPKSLIVMKDVTVKYGEQVALNSVSWVVNSGENWMVRGGEGAGKTSLMTLITGDNPQAYSNDISLFGKRRGSGESVWELKKYISVVSPEMHLQFSKRINTFKVICTGFFDTIGLYKTCSQDEVMTAQRWVDALGIAHLINKDFQFLSHGQRQMVLIARAMVKSPRLLILDNLCQGLDVVNRRKVLEMIDAIGFQTETVLIYTAYTAEDYLSCTTHVLSLEYGTVKSARKIQQSQTGSPERQPALRWDRAL